MIINRHRGELAANLGGKERCLCLTLGALAHLETSFGAEDLTQLTERFSKGRLSAGDLLSIIHAGLLGGGHDFSRQEVAEMQVEGGVAGYAYIVSKLLNLTFGGSDEG